MNEFGLFALRPGIVVQAELNTIRNGGVIVKKENAKRAGIRVVVANFAENLKRLRGYLA